MTALGVRMRAVLAALSIAIPGFSGVFVPTPQLGVFTTASDGLGTPGAVIDRTLFGPTELPLASFSYDTIYANAYASASHGVLRLLAMAQTSGGNVTTATASAYWADQVVLSEPSRNGLPGLAQVSFSIDGGYTLGGVSPHSVGTLNVSYEWDAYRVDASRISIYYRNFTDSSNGFTEGEIFLNRLQTILVPFTWGEAFVIQLSVGVGVAASDPLGTGVAAATGDLLHTVVWKGITVLDPATGLPVSGHTLSSLSGTNWLEPASIPEPASAVMVVAAGIVFGIRRYCKEPN